MIESVGNLVETSVLLAMDSLCYICENPIEEEEESTECDNCESSFHLLCADVQKSAVNANAKHKCLLLYCPECVEKRSSSTKEKVKKILNLLYKIDLFQQNQKPQNVIDSELIKSMAVKLNDVEKKIDTCNVQVRSNSSSNIVSNGTHSTTPTYASVFKRSNVKPAVVIKPKKQQNSAKTLEAVTNKVTKSDLKVCGTRNVRDGGIVLRCENSTETMKAKQIINEKLGDDYEVILPKIKNPRLRVTNLPIEIPEENITSELKIYNESIIDIEMRVVTVLNRKATSSKTSSNDVVIEVNGAGYKKLLDLKTLRLPWTTCNVLEHVYVKRCYKCLGFSHIAKDCKGDQKCSKCGGAHKYSDCKSKKLCCANCHSSNEKHKTSNKTNHHAWSKDCAVYKRRIETLMNKIEYNETE